MGFTHNPRDRDKSVLLLHGFGQNGSVWDGVRPLLPDWFLTAPDLRGHRKAGSVRPINARTLIDDACELGKQLECPVLVGYSMGGRVALRAAIEAPDLWSGLVLISTTAGIEDATARRTREAADADLARLLASSDREAFEAAWERLPIWSGDSPTLRETAMKLRLQSNPTDLAEVLNGFGSGTVAPVWAELAKIEIPAVILAGERDTTYCAHAERLKDGIPNASLNVVERCGHCLPLESPQAVADAVVSINRRLQRAES